MADWESAPVTAGAPKLPQQDWETAKGGWESPQDWESPEASWGKVAKAIPGTALGGAQTGIGGTLEYLGEHPVTVPPIGPFALPSVRALVEEVNKAWAGTAPAQAMTEVGRGIAETGDITSEMSHPGNIGFWKRAVLSGVSSSAQMMPGLAASLVTKSLAPAVGAAGALEGGQAYHETRQEFDPERSAYHAGVSAAAETLFEMIPTSFLVKNFESKPVLELIFGTYIREGYTEVLTTAVQEANRKLSIKPDMSFEEWGWSLLDTLGSVAVSAPLQAGAARGLGRLTRGKPAQEITPEPQPSAPPKPEITPPRQTRAVAVEEFPGLDALLAEEQAPMTADQIAESQRIVAEAERLRKKGAQAEQTPPVDTSDALFALDAPMGRIQPETSTPELGASVKQAANAINYPEVNVGDRRDWKVSIGPEWAAGKTSREIVAERGQVPAGTLVIGELTPERPGEYMQALYDSVEEWRTKYTPNATIFLSTEKLESASAVGWHYGAQGQHLIVPAVLRDPRMGLAEYNQVTQVRTFYNAPHEFGHVLVFEKFFDQVTPAVAAQVRREAAKGAVSQGTLDLMPEGQRALLQEFNVIRDAVFRNKITAAGFVRTWMSPGKVSWPGFLAEHKVAPDAPAIDIVRAMVRRAVDTKRNQNLSEGQKQALRRELMQDMLGIDEYLAEQTARYAYLRGWDKTTPLGRFFAGVLRTMREYFTDIKRAGWVRPGTKFTEWMDGLGNTKMGLDTTSAALQQAGPKAKEPALSPPPQAPPKPRVQRLDHNVQTSTKEAKVGRANRLTQELILDGTIERDSSLYEELKDSIAREDWDNFTDLFQDLTGRKVRFQINDMPEGVKQRFMFDGSDQPAMPWDSISVLTAGISEETAKQPGVIADAAREWKEKGFASKYFKAWFGDWEQSPGTSSQVIEPTGRPLVTYHATKYQHETARKGSDTFVHFGEGDVGFHFGTARAAHVRGYGLAKPYAGQPVSEWMEIHRFTALMGDMLRKDQMPSKTGLHIIPAALNIRNPLDIGVEDLEFWASPRHALFMLKHMGVITAHEQATAEMEWQRLDLENEKYRSDIGDEAGNLDEHLRPPHSLYAQFEPVRKLLVEKGYDGIKYHNLAEGDTSFVALHPNQVKSLLSSRTFSQSLKMHMELDYDRSTPQGLSLSQFWRGMRNFFEDPGPMRRALRRVQNLAHHTLQIQQLAHLHPDISALDLMNEDNIRYNTRKSALMAPSDAIAERWSKLTDREYRAVNEFFLQEMESEEHWFDIKTLGQLDQEQGRPVRAEGSWRKVAVPNARTVDEMRKLGLTGEDSEAAQLVLDTKNDILHRMDERQITMLNLLAARFEPNSLGFVESARQLKNSFREIHARPWFPQGRFGNYQLTIERKKEDGRGYEVVYREAFENQQNWTEAWNKARQNVNPDERVRKHQLGDKDYVMMSLPLDFVDLAASEFDLTTVEVDQLMNILQPIKVEKALRTYDLKRLGLKGYSSDALRSYANYAWHDSNLIAKLEYRSKFNNHIRSVRSLLREAEYSRTPESMSEAIRLQSIARAMERARDYVMAPPNEAQSLRALVSIGYLGLNVKTALVNFFGLMFTWSDMVSRRGLVDGSARMAKATAQMFSTIKLTNLNERAGWSRLDNDTQWALDKALEEGVLSQSYAYHLAGMANRPNLFRLPARQVAERTWRGALDAAMWPFRLTELSIRRVAFIAQYQEARDSGLDPGEAYDEAIKRVAIQQNDYSNMNRVPFMRGVSIKPGNPLGRVFEPVIPMATIFWSFAQHAAFHSYGGYELGERRRARLQGQTTKSAFTGYTMRLWILLLLAAGYEGLPGAENLIDLLEAAWRKWGDGKPLRQSMRELVKQADVGIDPQTAAHGLGYNAFGFDISRSVGFGRFVPGTDTLSHPKSKTEEMVGTLVLDMMGATGSFIHFGLEAMFSDKPLSETMKRLPGGMGNIYTAYKWSQEGVRSPSSAIITRDLETGELRDLTAMEIWGKVLGFNPTVVSQERQIRFEMYDRQIYWQARRKQLMDDYWRSLWKKDLEAQKDVKDAIEEFNAGLGPDFRDMRIRGSDLARSRATHRRIVREEERGRPTQRRYREIGRGIRESYESPE